MNIEDIKNERDELGKGIDALIAGFEKRTGCQVEVSRSLVSEYGPLGDTQRVFRGCPTRVDVRLP